jgi:hypothetical protein
MKLTKAYLLRIFTNLIIALSISDQRVAAELETFVEFKYRPFTLAIISFRSDPHLVEDRTSHTDPSKSDTSDKRTWQDDRAHEIESRKKTTSAAESYDKHLI